VIKQIVGPTLPWLGLVSLLAAACALETALASLPPTVAPSTPNGGHISAPRGDRLPLTIMLRDSASGSLERWQCLSDQAPIDNLVVETHALADVAAALCGP
jgi:hypothetical protein